MYTKKNQKNPPPIFQKAKSELRLGGFFNCSTLTFLDAIPRDIQNTFKRHDQAHLSHTIFTGENQITALHRDFLSWNGFNASCELLETLGQSTWEHREGT